MSEKGSMKRKESRQRIMLVDDHPLTRGGLAHLIDNQPDLAVCGQAGSAEEALKILPTAKPDLVVQDISLEGKSGLELIKDFHVLYSGLPVLVMSMHDESLYAERALRAGARGYVMKRAGGETVLQAIRQILTGKVYLSEAMSERLLESFGRPERTGHQSPIENLTDREFEVFKLIGEGLITREIGKRLYISHKTVDVYRQRLKEKLNLPTSTSLVQHAVRWVETQNRI